MYVYVVCIDTRRDNQTQQYPNASASKPAYDLQMFQPGLIFKCSILNAKLAAATGVTRSTMTY